MSPDEFTGGPVDATSPADPAPPGPLPFSDITNPQSLNKYAYTYNNPLRYVDPNGHCLWDICIGESIVVYAIVTTAAVAATVAANNYVRSPQGQRVVNATHEFLVTSFDRLLTVLSETAKGAADKARSAADKLSDAVSKGGITGEGVKGVAQAQKHVDALRGWADEASKLLDKLDKSKGQKEREKIGRKLDEVIDKIKGHAKEVEQKWRDIESPKK